MANWLGIVRVCTRAVPAIVVVTALLLATDARAHRPWFNLSGSPDPSAPYQIEDVAVSQVIYGGFDRPGRVDYYRLRVEPGFPADVQMVVPDVPACAAFRPTLVILGAGLDTLEELPIGLAPPDEAPVTGIVAADKVWGTFFEPFTGTTYATGPRVRAELAGGDYLLAVIEPEGDVGTYGLALGGAERFGGDPLFLTKIEPIERCEPPALPDATPAASPGAV